MMTDTSTRTRLRVSRFGGPDVLTSSTVEPGPARRGRVRVRITHASLGSTDALARRGGYLLQPRAGFTPGYDLVGIVERSTADASARGLTEGSRVAASLPRMGAHATSIDVPARLLVPVPDALDSEVAASLPLDLVTAGLAWSLAAVPAGGGVLVQGASGPVGGYLVQTARAAGGHPVLGTSSASTRAVTESLGATWLDYRDPTWVDRVLEAVPHGVAAAFDHTGSASLRRAVTADGTLVRLSFVGRPGHERRDTFTGGVRALARTFGRRRERVVSVPLFVALRPAAYRAMLAVQLERVANGALTAPEVEVVPMADAAQAHARLEAGLAGRKLVLAT